LMLVVSIGRRKTKMARYSENLKRRQRKHVVCPIQIDPLKMDELSVVLPKEVANVLILGVNI
jgi:short-subunit dehydrogenase